MIPINELRVNDWVIYNKEKLQVDEPMFYALFKGAGETSPIPLTTEILEKAGFAHHDRTISLNDSGYDPKTFWYTQDGMDDCNQKIYRNNFLLGQFKDGFYYQANYRRSKGTPVKYLHQLQNLIFCLTGEELKIQL